jgi:4-methylaminobutanoate oxidase (formaldehyde-forming)
VKTSEGDIPADRVIVTAGPWTGMLASLARVRMPMQTIRHQRVRTVPAAGIPDHHPVVRVTDVSCYVRPDQGGYLYGYFEPHPTTIPAKTLISDFRTDDIPIPKETMAEARQRLAPVFPVLAEWEIAEYRQGITTFRGLGVCRARDCGLVRHRALAGPMGARRAPRRVAR